MDVTGGVSEQTPQGNLWRQADLRRRYAQMEVLQGMVERTRKAREAAVKRGRWSGKAAERQDAEETAIWDALWLMQKTNAQGIARAVELGLLPAMFTEGPTAVAENVYRWAT